MENEAIRTIVNQAIIDKYCRQCTSLMASEDESASFAGGCLRKLDGKDKLPRCFRGEYDDVRRESLPGVVRELIEKSGKTLTEDDQHMIDEFLSNAMRCRYWPKPSEEAG